MVELSYFVLVTLSAILSSLLFYIASPLKKYFRTANLLNKFTGPPTVPIFGNALNFNIPHKGYFPLVGSWFKKYGGGELRIWLAHKPVIVLASAASVFKVLSSSSSTVKGEESYIFQPWLGSGLFIAEGQKWSMLRKLLTPSFHFKALEDFVKAFNKHSRVLVSLLEQQCDGMWKTMDIFQYAQRCTLDMICENALGINNGAQVTSNSEYALILKEYNDLIMNRILLPWYRPQLIWKFTSMGRREKVLLKRLHRFTEDMIQIRKDERKLNGQQSQPKNFINLLLDLVESGSVLTDKDIRDQADTFIFGGYATTAVSFSATLFFLAQNPDCQNRVLQEVQEIAKGDKNAEFSTNDLAEMKYLECCIKESLRIFPPVPLISRNTEEDIQLDDGRVIPKGITAVVSPYYLHRDESVFPKPEIYDPDRFSLENSTKRSAYAYIPFAAGQRNCIGQRYSYAALKTLVARMVLNFELEGSHEMPELNMIPEVTLRPVNGVKIRMKKRGE